MKPLLLTVGAWCLLLTFVVFHHIAVYQLSRWGICGVAAYGASQFKDGRRWALGAVALTFNPIIPFHLGREAWKYADAAAAGIFFITASLKKTT